MNSPLISVIIPTYNDWAYLEKCLHALSKQTLQKELFEILVINNNPKDSPDFNYSKFSNLRIFIEEKPGSYAARNKGILNSRGQILAFTDSDCKPDTEWLANALISIQQGDTRIGGPIILFSENPQKTTLAEIYETIASPFPQEIFIKIHHYSPTANMVTLRKNFESVGLFNDKLMSGGDLDWGTRASNAGINIQYKEDLIVYHPTRATISQLVTKSRRIAGGLLKIEGETNKLKLAKEIIRGFFPPLFFYSRSIKPLKTSLAKKFLLFFLHYFIKIISSTEKIILIARIKSPVRI